MTEPAADERAANPDPLLPVLLQGAEKSFENADQLYREAQILAQHGALARALCLHQISLEECSKVDSLGAWATSLAVGFKVDQKKALSGLASHASKNRLNAFMLEISAEEIAARERGDWKAAQEHFREAQDQFHATSNQAKNASLYVDWIDGGFVAPADRIAPELLVETAQRNAIFLGYAQNNVRTLRRLVRAPEELREPLLELVQQIKKLRQHPPVNLQEAFDAIFSHFTEQAMAKVAERQSRDSSRD